MSTEQKSSSRFSSEDACKITHAFLDVEDSLTINKRLFQFYSASTAIVLSDLFAKERRLSRMENLREDGLFAAPASNRQSTTGLKTQTYKHHLDELVEDGVITAKREGLPSRILYKINHEILAVMYMDGKRPNSQCRKIYATSAVKEKTVDKIQEKENRKKGSPLTTPYIERKREEKKKINHKNQEKERGVRAGTREGNLEDSGRKKKERISKWSIDENWLSYFTKDFTAHQDFVNTWMEWIDYRRHVGKSLHKLPKAGPEQAKDLMRGSPEAAITALKESMRNGWTGLFPKTPQKFNGFDFTNKSADFAVPKVDWKGLDIHNSKFSERKKKTEERAFEMWKNLKGTRITAEIEANLIYFAHKCMVFAECETVSEYRYHYGTGASTIKVYEKFILEHRYYSTFSFTTFAGLKYGGKIWEAFVRYKSGTLGQNILK